MLFPHPEAADQAVPPYGKLASQLKSFRALGSAALSAPGLRSLCPEAFAAFDADPTPQARAKRFEAVCAVLGFSEAYVASPLGAALANLRQLAPMLYELAPAEPKVAAPAVKTVFRGVFKGTGHLSLSAQEAQAFLEFSLEVLYASMPDGKKKEGRLLTAQPWRAVPEEDLDDLATFLAEAVGALNTHDSKSSHPSAQYQYLVKQVPAPSRFLSSELFDSYVSGRIGGGTLQYVSWLEFLLPFRIRVADGAPVAIYELLIDRAARDVLARQGVTALKALPIVEPKWFTYDPHLLPRVSVKVDDQRSEWLNLMPANSMLRATAELGLNIQLEAQRRLAQAVRSQALDGLPELESDERFSLARFETCVSAGLGNPDTKKLFKELATLRKQHGLKVLEPARLLDGKAQFPGKRRYIPRSGVVANQPQICGGAYLAEAGTRGLYRFPAATYQQASSTDEERKFHGALESEFRKRIGHLRESIHSKPGPHDLAKVDRKWLPARVQKLQIKNHVELAVGEYLELLRRLRKKFALDDESALLRLVPSELKPIQRFVLDGAAVSEEDLQAVAQAGVGILKVNDQQAASSFVEQVKAVIQGKTQ